MIRSVCLTSASVDKSIILKVLIDRGGVVYRHMISAELLSLIASAINFLADAEAKT
jgi:hypothetical protein